MPGTVVTAQPGIPGTTALKTAATATLCTPVPHFEDIYRAHYAKVTRWVRVCGVPELWVDDVAQDVFVLVHRKLPEYEARGSMTAWLFAITRRVAKDFRRGRARAQARNEKSAPPTEFPSQDESIARHEALEFMEHFLGRLDEAKRFVFVLSDVDGLSAPEVAEVLDIPAKTVRSRLRVARGKFEEAVARKARSEQRRLDERTGA